MNSSNIDQLAKQLWNYHQLNHSLKQADLILVLGSHDLRVAEYAADLFLHDLAPLIMFSGGVSHQEDLLEPKWGELSESEKFAEVAVKKGVPKDKILIENQSTNTGENIQFSYKLIKDKGLNPKKIILVQKPYMERRSYATFKKQWPGSGVNIIITSPPISYEDYPSKEISKEEMLNIMVGDLQRIKVYPAKGFMIPQEIPDDVWQAFEELVNLGYNKRLVKE